MRAFFRRYRGWLWLAGFVFIMTLCAWPVIGPYSKWSVAQRVEAARTMWENSDVESYEITVKPFPLGLEYRITVRDGVVVTAESRPGFSLTGELGPFRPAPLQEADDYTIERLFRYVAEQLAMRHTVEPDPCMQTRFEADFDATLGYVKSFVVDECPSPLCGALSHCRYGVIVTGFDRPT